MIFRRGRLFAAGGFAPSLAYGICFAVGAIGFPLAIQSTFGANALVILSISPLLSAVGARILLGEKIAKATWIASFFAVFGVGFIFADGFGSGRCRAICFALATAFSIAGGSIVARRHRNLDTIPGIAIGGAIAAAVCIPFADFSGALELSPQVFCSRPQRRINNADGFCPGESGKPPAAAAGSRPRLSFGNGTRTPLAVARRQRNSPADNNRRRRFNDDNFHRPHIYCDAKSKMKNEVSIEIKSPLCNPWAFPATSITSPTLIIFRARPRICPRRICSPRSPPSNFARICAMVNFNLTCRFYCGGLRTAKKCGAKF